MQPTNEANAMASSETPSVVELRAALAAGSAQPVSGGVFDFTVDGRPRLAGSNCPACGTQVFPATRRCPNCYADGVQAALLPESGVLDSFTVVHQPPPGWRGAVPYVIAKVQLEGGPTVLSQLCDSVEPRSGMALRLALRRLYQDDNGRDVVAPVFVPA